MTRLINALMYVMLALWMTACGGGGGSAGTPTGSANPSNFKVNAPAETTLAVGQKVTYGITGGLSPYQLNNSAPNIASAAVVGSSVEITPLRVGTATLGISPSGSAVTQTIVINVASSANPLQVQAPDLITLRLGNAASYVVSGGLPPYRAESSSPSVLSAVVVGDKLQVTATGVGSASVVIYDASTVAPIQRSFSVVATAAFFTSAPANLSMGNGTQRQFSVSGGVAPYYVSSSNSAVADASVANGVLTVVAGATRGSADVLLRDSGGSEFKIVTTVGTNVAFYTDAPDTLTIQAGVSPRSFVLGGGTAPYTATSANENVVKVAVSSNGFTLTAQNKGTAKVKLADQANGSIELTVTVDQGSGTAVSVIEVTSDPDSIKSSGQEALITAFVKGANNVGVANADIAFKSTSGILLAPSAQTNASGVATVRLASGSNGLNRVITVTATVGAVSGTKDVTVGGSSLKIEGSPQTSLSVGGDAQEIKIKALDTAGNGIKDLTINATNNIASNAMDTPAVTDADGIAKFLYKPVTSGEDTLKFSAANTVNMSAELKVSISSVSFQFVDAGSLPLPTLSSPKEGATVAVDSDIDFTVRLKIDKNNTDTARLVTFTTTRGTLTHTSVTIPAGQSDASVKLRSSSAGSATVTAEVQVPVGTTTVTAKASRTVKFTGVKPASLRVQANPSSIGPSTVTTPPEKGESKSTITATVLDSTGNPVSKRPVQFVIQADPSNGRLDQGVANTDENGIATISYIAGINSSPVKGVKIRASVPSVNGDITTPLTTVASPGSPSDAELTVAGNALFISIGVSNTITNVDGDPSTYEKPFSVYVTDASGLAVPEQKITLTVRPTQFRKGELYYIGAAWGFRTSGTPLSVQATCVNEDRNFDGVLQTSEDANGNGVLDPGEDSNGNGLLDISEDTNRDGSLTPGNVVIAYPATVTTNSNGLAVFSLRYGEQFAKWIDVDVIATATVGGTETRRALPFELTGMASDFDQEAIRPAGIYSPFGRGAGCDNAQ